jgi:hypothetical protein
VLHAVNRVESYRLNNRPDLAQMGNFAFDAFMYYPRVVSPSSVEYSTDDTYLDALNLYRSFRSSASLSPAAIALVEFAPAA